MPTNFYMLFVAALIPMIMGMIYYNPKVVGNAWMKVNGFTTESLQGGNMTVTLIVAYIFSVLIAFMLPMIVMHQGHVWSMMAPEVMESGSAVQNEFAALMESYGDRYRSFGHGAVHGAITTIFFVLPIIGTISIFERRGWKYIMIHAIYWLITLILMGGLLCATLNYEIPA